MFDIIVVVYNEALSDLSIVDRLTENSLAERIIVCDNSDNGMNEGFEPSSSKVVYLDMGGNKGLSRAYNQALSMARADFVILLDDDTVLPVGVLEDYRKAIADNPDADILVPVVREGGVIYSPARCGRYVFRPVRHLGQLDLSNFSGINSGMLLKRASLWCSPFDERLFLDLVDHQFLRDARMRGLNVRIAENVALRQSFSFNEVVSVSTLRRLEIYRQDSRVFYSGSLDARLFRGAQLLKKYTTYCFARFVERVAESGLRLRGLVLGDAMFLNSRKGSRSSGR